MTMTTHSYSVTRLMWDESDVSEGLEFCTRHELPFRKNVTFLSVFSPGNRIQQKPGYNVANKLVQVDRGTLSWNSRTERIP